MPRSQARASAGGRKGQSTCPVSISAPFHQIGKMAEKPCICQPLADLAIKGVVLFLGSAAWHLGKIPMVVLWSVGRRVFRGAKLTNLFYHM